MDSSVEAVAASLEALSQKYRGITHNLANANTVGYKRRFSTFTRALADQMSVDGDSATAQQTGVVGSTTIDFSPGALMRTGRRLDLALADKGFFVLQTPEATFYTRNGAFRTNRLGQLVDFENRIVAGKAGPITLPATVSPSQVEVSADGRVSAAGRFIGALDIADFEDPEALMPVGGCCFRAPEGVTPVETAKISVQQGFRESSNVEVVSELVDLISVTRMYEANLKAISKDDDRMKHILQVAMA